MNIKLISNKKFPLAKIKRRGGVNVGQILTNRAEGAKLFYFPPNRCNGELFVHGYIDEKGRVMDIRSHEYVGYMASSADYYYNVD